MVSQCFYGIKLNDSINRDQAVAIGATIRAAIELGLLDEDGEQ